ncbi:MAG: hypothetical protein NW216_03415 [Hyphomicrobium sp.]|nr:hypothetical protein [Hyphomicrobium sp.]
MSKLFFVLAIALIAVGAIVLLGPLIEAVPGPSLGPMEEGTFAVVRDVAQQVNAPLSILFGLMSLYYSRRTYLERKRENERNGRS